MSVPEQPMYQLRNELIGLTEEANAHVGENEPCMSLDLTLHGVRRAVEHLNSTVYGAFELAEVSVVQEGNEETSSADAAVLDVCQEAFDLATELSEVIRNVRKGVQQCPGNCPGGACGLSTTQQQDAFWRKPPPMFIHGKRYNSREC